MVTWWLPRVWLGSARAGLTASKQRPLWRLLVGLNIRHVGTRTAQILADRFGLLDEIMRQSEESLATVDEVGAVIAKTIHAYFTSDTAKQLIAGRALADPVFAHRRYQDAGTQDDCCSGLARQR